MPTRLHTYCAQQALPSQSSPRLDIYCTFFDKEDAFEAPARVMNTSTRRASKNSVDTARTERLQAARTKARDRINAALCITKTCLAATRSKVSALYSYLLKACWHSSAAITATRPNTARPKLLSHRSRLPTYSTKLRRAALTTTSSIKYDYHSRVTCTCAVRKGDCVCAHAPAVVGDAYTSNRSEHRTRRGIVFWEHNFTLFSARRRPLQV